MAIDDDDYDTQIEGSFIDDTTGKVLITLSTNTKQIKGEVKYGGNKNAAEILGKAFAELAKKQGVNKVSFDRGGYLYHGRIKAFAEAARKGGMEF